MSEQNTQTNFIGKYITDMRDVLVASVVAQQHSFIISPPGWAKTSAIYALASEIAGDGCYSIVTINPSTMPAKIEGMPDPAKLLATPPSYQLMTENTPYDPANRIVGLDELPRGSEVVFDMLLDLLARFGTPRANQPVIWATGNFTMASDRAEALTDRFALTAHLRPTLTNIRQYTAVRRNTISLASPYTTPTMPGPLPTWEEIEAVRYLVPGDNAHNAIDLYLETIQQEAEAANFTINPRRVTQWYDLLFRYSAWLLRDAGGNPNPNFTTLPPQAVSIMRHAYPTLDWETYARWNEVVGSSADPLASALEQVLADIMTELSRIHAGAYQAKPTEKGNANLEVASIVRKGLERLREIGGDDDRVQSASNTLSKLLTATLTSIMAGTQLPRFEDI